MLQNSTGFIKNNLNTSMRGPKFVFFGRLTYEKGFDIICAFADYVLNASTGVTLEICGEGEGSKELLNRFASNPYFLDLSKENSIIPELPVDTGELLNHEPKASTEISAEGISPRVVYYGRIPHSKIREIVSGCNYSLMPSRFLETFGLSALESIQLGVPVIGIAKGGLSQFLLSHHRVLDSINQTKVGNNFLKKIDEVVDGYTFEYWKSESAAARNISERYNLLSWQNQIVQTLTKLSVPSNGRVLILSDFSAQIGGIETHIELLRTNLEKMGYQQKALFALTGKTKISRMSGFLLAWCNIIYSWKLQKVIRDFQPDCIWLQSVNRAIGPIGLIPLANVGIPSIATYHDFGFVSPYPSAIFHESQVPEWSIRAFFLEGRRVNGYIGGFLGCLKFYLLLLQKRYFQKVAIHFVPSEFLEKYVAYQFGETAKIVVLPHPSTFD